MDMYIIYIYPNYNDYIYRVYYIYIPFIYIGYIINHHFSKVNEAADISRRPRFRHLGQCPAAPGAFRSPRRGVAAGCQGTGTDPAGAREEARRKLEILWFHS